MNKEEIVRYDFSQDQTPPNIVQSHLRGHDTRMDAARIWMSLARAVYKTEFWPWVDDNSSANADGGNSAANMILDRVEVNRLKPALAGYVNSLYPRRGEVTMGRDPTRAGDPKKAQEAIKMWLRGDRMRDRVLLGARQALMYPGAGAKVGYDKGTGSPIDRTWLRIFPWWELVTDHDVYDWRDERFIGHCYFAPKHEIAEKYKLLKLSGRQKTDYLSGSSVKSKGQTNIAPDDSKEDEYVRLLELCNFKDQITEQGERFIGRLEVYVLDSGELSKRPVWMGPMPLSNPDGSSLSHIAPLIFDHDPEHPYHGLAYFKQLSPQIVEVNTFRSHISSAAARDTRVYVVQDGVLTPKNLNDLTDGADSVVIQYKGEDFPNLRPDQVVGTVQIPAISGNIYKAAQQAAADLEAGMTTSPAALGVITKATAEEVRAVEAHTESEFGRHAEERDKWLSEIVKRALAAMRAAMLDTGDSEGAFEDRPAEALVETTTETAENTDAKPERDEVDPALIEAATPTEPVPDVPEPVAVESTITIIGANDEVITITAADLDANFDIGFSEGGRSPLGDHEMKKNLLTLMEPYLALWDRVQKGDPLARGWMVAMHARFELPADLHPDALEAAQTEQKGKGKGKQEAPDEDDKLAAIAQMPPDQALAALAEVFADQPEVMAMIEKASQMPPEQQAEVVKIILSNVNPPES